MAETKSKGDHSGHICVLASNQKFAEIKAITKNPHYICFNCGRVADCDANLSSKERAAGYLSRAFIKGQDFLHLHLQEKDSQTSMDRRVFI